MGAKPAGGLTLAQVQQASSAAKPNPSDPLDGFATIAAKLFGNQSFGATLGNSISGIVSAGKDVLHGDLAGAGKALNDAGAANSKLAPRAIGDVVKDVALPLSLGLAAPASLAGAAAQYGGLGAASSAGQALSEGASLPDAATSAAEGGAIGAVTGGAFNLLGKTLAKGGPAALAFTSGVPKNAIETAAANPSAAKEGLGLSVADVRSKAVASLQTLHNDLSSEFTQGLEQLPTEASEGAIGLSHKLTTDAQQIASQFKVATKAGIGGITADFSTSPIVKGGEETAVSKALQTVSTWNDFTPQGMQTLSERIGALRNFESGAATKSSAIVGKLYNSVNDAIKATYPQLSTLRTNYAANRKVLDEIGNVLSSTKDKPTQIQASVSRLDNLFSQNRDEYLNAIKQLGDRSGIDYLSLLAGGEFQKVLPGFVRGLGGGGAVGVGASLLNPYLLLLAPLFSPRVAGVITRNASSVAKTAAPIVRAATTRATQELTRRPESQ